MGSTHLEKASRAFAAFAAITTAGLQKSSNGDPIPFCPTPPVYHATQAPDVPMNGNTNFKIKPEEPWYYSLDIQRIFNPDGSMNISSTILENIKRDAATTTIAQYAGRNARVNSQKEQLTTTLVNATCFLDRKSYEEIRNQMIKDKRISEKRSMNDIYVINGEQVFINQDSMFLTKAITTTGNTVALLNKQGYPTRTARIYLESAYGIVLYNVLQ